LASENYDEWLDKDGQHNTTVIRKGLTSQDLVDFCDRARREFYLRPAYIFKQAKMALTDSRERYRVLRGAGTLVKHLFKKHGAPQESSGYAAKAKAASSHSHTLEETIAEVALRGEADVALRSEAESALPSRGQGASAGNHAGPKPASASKSAA
jgi:hypothetical protein